MAYTTNKNSDGTVFMVFAPSYMALVLPQNNKQIIELEQPLVKK